MPDNTLLTAILHQSMLLFLLIGTALALVIALMLLLLPTRSLSLIGQLDRWVSLRRPLKPLETVHSIERVVYHHHLAIGLLLILATGYLLYQLAFAIDPARLPTLWAGSSVATRALLGWLFQLLWWLALPLNLLLLLIGAVLGLRPSLLRRVEQWANRWISTRQIFSPLADPHYPLDTLLRRHPRRFGGVLLLLATYGLALLLMLYMKKFL